MMMLWPRRHFDALVPNADRLRRTLALGMEYPLECTTLRRQAFRARQEPQNSPGIYAQRELVFITRTIALYPSPHDKVQSPSLLF